MGKDRRKDKGGAGWKSWGLLLAGFLIGAAFIVILFRLGDFWKTPSPVKVVEKPVIVPPKIELPQREISKPEKPLGEYPKVAIVIDDMGQDLNKLNQLFQLHEPITIAVMPNLRYSRETADRASNHGLEVLLHLPMEPKDLKDNNPGKGALFTRMTQDEIRNTIEKDLKTVPHAIGVNNHMGSRFTENEASMKTVLLLVKKKDMFFLDSRTTPNSVGEKMAREIGVRNAGRNVFLDNTREDKYIKGQISELISIAKKRGRAIAIGHPYPETIEALSETVSKLNNSGIKVVKLSELEE